MRYLSIKEIVSNIKPSSPIFFMDDTYNNSSLELYTQSENSPSYGNTLAHNDSLINQTLIYVRQTFNFNTKTFNVDIKETEQSIALAMFKEVKTFYWTHCGMKKPNMSKTGQWLDDVDLVAHPDITELLAHLYRYINSVQSEPDFYKNRLENSKVKNILAIIELIRNKYE